MLVKFGFILNYQSGLRGGFDAFSASRGARVFVLADGANSSPSGGRASQLAVDTVCNEIQCNPKISPAGAFDIAHRKIREAVSNSTGTTCISLHINNNLCIGGCGDSLAEVYTQFFISGWRLSWRSTPDIQDQGNAPSQLLGSDVYWGPAESIIDIRKKTLVLMMTDGAYKFTLADDRRKLIANLAGEVPSNSDLDYLARCLGDLAHSNGSRDDISAVFIWIDPNADAENIY